ncbi:tumor protein p53-inducible protein 13 isoform X2 [Bombina bombina]|nr:tumor protein p53-inducible protein 13 isoform X2 [Bombina bombina]
MDTQIEYASMIPNSGAHRPKLAKYGQYIYCPPQRWVHNLKHGGVAFLYHPCVHPQLKEALSLVARACMYKHIITPFGNLSRQRPLALAAWCSTLEMSHLNLSEVVDWLKLNVYRAEEYKQENEGSYQHLLIWPSSVISDKKDMEICPRHYLQTITDLLKDYRKPLAKRNMRRRSLILLPVSDHESSVSQLYNASDRTGSNKQSTVNLSITNPELHHTAPNTVITVSSSPASVIINATSVPSQRTPDIALVASDDKRELETHTESNLSDQKISSLENIIHKPAENTVGSPSLKNGVGPEENYTMNQSGTNNSDLFTFRQYERTSNNSFTASDQREKVTKLVQKPTLAVSPKPSDLKGKSECSCAHETTHNPVAQAQKASSHGKHKSPDMFIATPRTEEATWAVASLTFLFVLLTLSVLYTQIYKKFRKSRSLYWSTSTFEQMDTVASVIKRRLQGQSKRKKRIGHRKAPVVVYESLSESSD